MLRAAIVFLVIALLAALLGFSGVAHLSFDAAQILVFAFLALAVIFAIVGMFRGAPPQDVV